MLASFAWGYIADRMNSIKKAFMLDLLISAVTIAVIPLLPTNFKYMSVMFIFYKSISCIGQGPLGTLIDNHAVRNCEEFGLNYGTITAFRCIAGTVGGILCTFVLGKIDLKYAFYIFGAMMIPTFICIFVSNDPVVVQKEKNADLTKGAGGMGILLGNYYFITFIVFAALFNIAHQPVTNFISFFMEDIGVATENFGIYNSVRVLTSIPFMFMFGWIRKRMKLRTILVCSCVCMGAESLFLGLFARSLVGLLLCGAIYGLGCGLFLGVVSLYIIKLAPEGLQATAHNIYGAVTVGAGILGNLVGGKLYEMTGGATFYAVIGIVMIVSVLFFAASLVFGRARGIVNKADES